MRIHPLASSSIRVALFVCALMFGALGIGVLIHRHALGSSSVPVVLLLLLLVCTALFYASFNFTRRINLIAATAERIIKTTDLSQRIPDDKGGDDLSKLSSVLNGMLGEIESLVKGIRTLSDNIAHDLRHPLTRLRNHIEAMKEDVADPGVAVDFEQALSGLIAECDALLTTFQALLRISNIESGKRHSGFRELDLARVVEDVVELYEPLAADKHIHFSFTPQPVRVTGDKDLLFQAFANLVDNAIKYTPEKGDITIAISPREKGGDVIIRDSGSGVSDEHKERVFRRFYRVEESRRAPGSGLGLSLVAAIIKLHRGMVQLHDNQPSGLIVTVTL
ncbi:MAG: HAMP domain-containing sensor histidine kinase [Alphaproteobacteria bacterium]